MWSMRVPIVHAEVQVLMSCMCGGGRIKRLGLQASTGRVQGSCDPGSPCLQLVTRTIFGQRGAKVPGNESSMERKFHLWNFRSRERKYVGTKVPVTVQRSSARTRSVSRNKYKKILITNHSLNKCSKRSKHNRPPKK